MKQLAFTLDSLEEYYIDTISTNQTKFNTNIERKIYLSMKNEKNSVDSNGKMRDWEDGVSGLRHPHFGFAKIVGHDTINKIVKRNIIYSWFFIANKK